MIDGPRRTALEEMYAARLKEERMRRTYYDAPGDMTPEQEAALKKYTGFDKIELPKNCYANVNRATYPRWKLSSDWKRPSRWQRLRWRIRALCRRVGAWFVEWPVVGRGG